MLTISYSLDKKNLYDLEYVPLVVLNDLIKFDSLIHFSVPANAAINNGISQLA